jgi:hypothetical protein
MDADTFKPADRVEELVHESLRDLPLDEGLLQRVESVLPPHAEMYPALRPMLRMIFGVCAATFGIASWAFNLPRLYGASTGATYVGLGAILIGAAIGATAIAVSILRDVGPRAIVALRGAFEGARGYALGTTIAAAVVLAAAWLLLGSFTVDYLDSALRAARSSVAMLAVIVAAAAIVQVSFMARRAEWRPAFHLVEAAGLVVAAIACAANYAIYVA